MSTLNPKCWASVVSQCRYGHSGEHLFSEFLFDGEEITVGGFPWCKDGEKTVGLASLKKKILCEYHNSLFSPLDTAAGNARKALQLCAEEMNQRRLAKSYYHEVKHLFIDAILLERWLLKTLINLSFQSEQYIGEDGLVRGIPDEHLVRVCFGLESFKGASGMYGAARPGADFNCGPMFAFAPLTLKQERVVGGFFHFRGILLFLWLLSTELPHSFEKLDPEWEGVTVGRLGEINLNIDDVPSHVIHYDWSSSRPNNSRRPAEPDLWLPSSSKAPAV